MRTSIHASTLFERYEGNPILTPTHWPYPANAVFNPGAAEVNGQTLLLVRVEDYRGFSHLTVARSWDCITAQPTNMWPWLLQTSKMCWST